MHAKVEPEREPKVVRNNSCVRVAPRKNEVKQQQGWRLVFVDRPETYQITNCLDEILFGEDIGYDFDPLSRSICASGSGCLSGVSHEVRLRKVQTAPALGMASFAQRIVEEEVSSDCVNTTPQMNLFRGAKVCSKWLQERIDDHNILSDNKNKSRLKVRIKYLVRYACVVTLHDTDTNDDMTTMTVFHTEHINTNT